MERRKFLKTLTLTSGALALGPQLYARRENILFQQLRELNQRLPLQRSYGIYHPAITGIRIAKKDYASLAKDTQTPEVTFENVPDFNGVPQPRCGLYRWVMISVTAKRCISGCIRFVSAGDLFYSTHDFYPPGAADFKYLTLRREDFEWENGKDGAVARVDACTAPSFADRHAWQHFEDLVQHRYNNPEPDGRV